MFGNELYCWVIIAIFIQLISEWQPLLKYVMDWIDSKDVLLEQ